MAQSGVFGESLDGADEIRKLVEQLGGEVMEAVAATDKKLGTDLGKQLAASPILQAAKKIDDVTVRLSYRWGKLVFPTCTSRQSGQCPPEHNDISESKGSYEEIVFLYLYH